MPSLKNIGIVGIGKMGRPIARYMIAGGFAVCGFDPAIAACERAAALGIRILPSPKQVARESDLVVILVGSEAQVDEVIFGDEGLLAGAAAGLVLAVGSTVAASYVRDVGRRVAKRGVRLVDIPVTRGEAAAENAELMVLGGGDEEVFSACRPVLTTFASDIFHLGPLGAGQVGKMVNNLILWACMAANDEGLRLAQAFGLDPDQLRRALVASSAQNWSLTTRADEKPVPWAEKDMTIVLHEADEARLSLPLCGCIKEVIKGFKLRKLGVTA